jgi:hypothetical protein
MGCESLAHIMNGLLKVTTGKRRKGVAPVSSLVSSAAPRRDGAARALTDAVPPRDLAAGAGFAFTLLVPVGVAAGQRTVHNQDISNRFLTM